jgi:hypothetical protein
MCPDDRLTGGQGAAVGFERRPSVVVECLLRFKYWRARGWDRSSVWMTIASLATHSDTLEKWLCKHGEYRLSAAMDVLSAHLPTPTLFVPVINVNSSTELYAFVWLFVSTFIRVSHEPLFYCHLCREHIDSINMLILLLLSSLSS